MVREEVVKPIEVIREVAREVEVVIEKPPTLQPVEVVKEVPVVLREDVPMLVPVVKIVQVHKEFEQPTIYQRTAGGAPHPRGAAQTPDLACTTRPVPSLC